MVTKARRRRPEARRGYQDGYAWAESGRSLKDLEVVMDYWTLQLPEDASDEIIDKNDTLYAKMRDEVFDDDDLAKLEEQSDDYQDGWWDGVVAFYVKEVTRKG
jgi:hypothetical protein